MDEEKQFEIKEKVTIGVFQPLMTKTLPELSTHCDECPQDYSYKNYVVKQIVNIAIAANAEIKRLQEDLKHVTCKLSKLTDDWTRITSVEQVKRLVAGYFIFALRDDRVLSEKIRFDIAVKDWDRWVNLTANGESEPFTDNDIVTAYKSYKLIRAFEKPEKKYQYDDGTFTLEEIAKSTEHTLLATELARDLLASQERVRELEGK